ncbi:glycerol-3-phosphate dehydrogenase, putative [Plasmodium knowlesi strain H]|uniref:Glycerol-3-phosphate dehydrogenase [NAD(+)] n=3 Tax=Plasmodium knowlesi TaxID=5850 RepID=A0A5K1VLW2_PLAKH|nr:glycerol-3-phosphate dehydrogenase [NAD(+)], putative [Plasmodium knowlesi strain H]OTN63921.1 Glycerol-3-phosphate dehydrogenase [NAD(+)] [Plasmodium knowlesi]CAA9990954.1 glycerol-3-phosphate dehydrogenase [NAD(+)], putative [Plasmodium knowlesi strain H]SBO20822.1 glycerol-3-phosphate dehydrogenase, putative [Plasmodium knowlesi strain H]SBO21245.1 glycerol-3-phosphate dehydrogenase, putative [Plasmodium knowlesi strain H]VVS80428.1 glycerol-3-phosphate dehydrogenase [NAD(+)], putative [|eukprot:XP_002262237.1 glycerol-3-phosphate dehydrogenase, putative [Plasmodium knowlesi strain H]
MYKSLFDKLKEGPLKISILGSGNWASAISKVVGTNAKNNYLFENEVKMWVRDERVNGESIVDIINKKHENVKYLKGVSLPHNIVAYSDLSKVINSADLLIFIIPSQYLENALKLIKENQSINIGKHTRAISLTKGFIIKNNEMYLCSKYISNLLGIPCSALSGANIAMDVAMEEFSEATIGGNENETLLIWQRVFDLPYFKINCVNETVGVEIFGALKNIITLAAGFCDGLNASTNSKSAIIRIGVKESFLFGKTFFNYSDVSIFFESCGLADIITSFLSGRNAKCSAEFVKCKPKKTWEQLESEILKGQKLQGIVTLKYVYQMIKKNDLTHEFPLFTILHKISFENGDPRELLNIFMNNTVSGIAT